MVEYQIIHMAYLRHVVLIAKFKTLCLIIRSLICFLYSCFVLFCFGNPDSDPGVDKQNGNDNGLREVQTKCRSLQRE